MFASVVFPVWQLVYACSWALQRAQVTQAHAVFHAWHRCPAVMTALLLVVTWFTPFHLINKWTPINLLPFNLGGQGEAATATCSFNRYDKCDRYHIASWFAILLQDPLHQPHPRRRLEGGAGALLLQQLLCPQQSLKSEQRYLSLHPDGCAMREWLCATLTAQVS